MEIFNTLSDINRVRIIMILIDREMCMSHIYLGLNLKQANTSKHIKLLKDSGIINVRISKQNRYFSLSETFLEEYSDIINFLKKQMDNDLYLEDVKNLKAVKTCSCIGQCECKI